MPISPDSRPVCLCTESLSTDCLIRVRSSSQRSPPTAIANVPMGRARMKLHTVGCLMCWLKKTPCALGTLKGACIACGQSAPRNPLIPFDGFFTKDVGALMLSLAKSYGYRPLSSEEDIIEFSATTLSGLTNSHRLQIHGDFSASNLILRNQLDQIIRSHYIPNIRCKATATPLVRNALDSRGYLSMLFPCNVVKETTPLYNSFRLSNLILPRLHESIADVVNAASKDKSWASDEFRSDVSASVAILCAGLVDAQEGLVTGSVVPLCGGAEMADILNERMKSTSEHLALLLRRRGISCNPEWSSALDGPLHNLRSNFQVSRLDIRTLKQTDLVNPMALTANSSVSMSLSPTSTLSSIDERFFKDPETSSRYIPVDINNWVDTGLAPSSTRYIEPSTSPEIEPQAPDTFNLIPPSPTNAEKLDLLFPMSSSLPFGDATFDPRRMTREMTSQTSAFRYSNTWNSHEVQPIIRGVNPEPSLTYFQPPARLQQQSLFSPMPSYVSNRAMSYEPAGFHGEMASQNSEPFGSSSWTTRSEHPNMWRQS